MKINICVTPVSLAVFVVANVAGAGIYFCAMDFKKKPYGGYIRLVEGVTHIFCAYYHLHVGGCVVRIARVAHRLSDR